MQGGEESLFGRGDVVLLLKRSLVQVGDRIALACLRLGTAHIGPNEQEKYVTDQPHWYAFGYLVFDAL